jgi:hypothetical protein
MGSDRAISRRMPRAWARLLVIACALAAVGCRAFVPARYEPPDFSFGPPPPQQNPALVTALDRDFVWDQVVDVVDDYFKIEKEERVRLVGDLLTEGRLDTYPRSGSTIFEPWAHDSANGYEKLESTLQSIRRIAQVRVIPAQAGYQVEVIVYKELEDVKSPETGAVSLANSQALRNDDALQRVTNPVGGAPPTLGWIRLGRDAALEQLMLAKIQERLGGYGAPPPF